MTKWHMSFSGQFILGSGNSFFLSRARGYGGFVCDGALRGGGGGGSISFFMVFWLMLGQGLFWRRDFGLVYNSSFEFFLILLSRSTTFMYDVYY